MKYSNYVPIHSNTNPVNDSKCLVTDIRVTKVRKRIDSTRKGFSMIITIEIK